MSLSRTTQISCWPEFEELTMIQIPNSALIGMCPLSCHTPSLTRPPVQLRLQIVCKQHANTKQHARKTAGQLKVSCNNQPALQATAVDMSQSQ